MVFAPLAHAAIGLLILTGPALAQTPPTPVPAQAAESADPAAQAPAAAGAARDPQAAPARAAQTPLRRDAGTLRITVVDETGAAIVDTPVSISNGAELTTTVQTGQRGEAVFENLVPGKYMVHIESIGFDSVDLADLTVKRGQTNKDVTMKIASFVEQVDVTRDETDKAINDSFSQALTQDQIEALPDDPDEMEEMLTQMAGPGARLRVNGFQGGRLPPKSQIAEIRFRFDPYSAENHDAGFPRVDIRTRPGQGNWRNSMTLTFRDDSLNARNAFAPVRGDEASQRGMWSVDGPLRKGKTSFSFSLGGLNSYDTETIRSFRADGSTHSATLQQPNDRVNYEGRIEHAINKSQMLRIELQQMNNTQRNLGIGEYVEEERAYSQDRSSNTFRISESGTVFKKYRNEVRFEAGWDKTEYSSLSQALAIDVLDQFSIGGAQRTGGVRSKEIELADDFDFALGKKHALRTGVELESTWYSSDSNQNTTGTYTFSTRDDFLAGLPRSFRQRQGDDPTVDYANTQFAWYINDDIKLRKNMMLSAGVRYEAQTHLGDRNNFAPRLHLTYSPFKSGSTTFRVGGGIFYDWYETGLYEDTLRVNGDQQQDVIIVNPCYPNPNACPGDPTGTTPASIIQASSFLVMPTVKRFSIGMERQITKWMQVRLNVFDQQGTNQFRSLNINAPVNGVRPIADLANVSQYETIGEAKSHGVEISSNFNYAARRMFAFIHYRYGKSESDGDASRLPQDSSNLAAEWGPAGQDIRHRINLSLNAPIAKGFRANTFIRYESASAYTITTGFDDNGDGVFYNDRPLGTDRNSARGRGAWTTDLRIGWTKGFGQPRTPTGPGGGPVRIQGPDGGGGRGGRGGGGGGGGPMMMMMGGPGEQKRFNIELFTQINNLLNNVRYTNFSGVLTSRQFGLPSGAQAPRRVELGARLGF
jgi:hypothetical protein